MIINTLSDLRAAMRIGQYAWPGGYECFFVADDGEPICRPCAWENKSQLIDSIAHNHRDGWRVTAFECSANYDSVGNCAHCNRNLSAYETDEDEGE